MFAITKIRKLLQTTTLIASVVILTGIASSYSASSKDASEMKKSIDEYKSNWDTLVAHVGDQPLFVPRQNIVLDFTVIGDDADKVSKDVNLAKRLGSFNHYFISDPARIAGRQVCTPNEACSENEQDSVSEFHIFVYDIYRMTERKFAEDFVELIAREGGNVNFNDLASIIQHLKGCFIVRKITKSKVEKIFMGIPYQGENRKLSKCVNSVGEEITFGSTDEMIAKIMGFPDSLYAISFVSAITGSNKFENGSSLSDLKFEDYIDAIQRYDLLRNEP